MAAFVGNHQQHPIRANFQARVVIMVQIIVTGKDQVEAALIQGGQDVLAINLLQIKVEGRMQIPELSDRVCDPILRQDGNGGNGEGKKPFQILLDAGLRYVIGGEAQYLKEGSIRREGGNVTYDLTESKTDMLRLHVGVVGRF